MNIFHGKLEGILYIEKKVRTGKYREMWGKNLSKYGKAEFSKENLRE